MKKLLFILLLFVSFSSFGQFTGKWSTAPIKLKITPIPGKTDTMYFYHDASGMGFIRTMKGITVMPFGVARIIMDSLTTKVSKDLLLTAPKTTTGKTSYLVMDGDTIKKQTLNVTETDPIWSADSAKVVHWADTLNKIATQYDISGFLSVEADPIYANDSANIVHFSDTISNIATKYNFDTLQTVNDWNVTGNARFFNNVTVDDTTKYGVVSDSANIVTTADEFSMTKGVAGNPNYSYLKLYRWSIPSIYGAVGIGTKDYSFAISQNNGKGTMTGMFAATDTMYAQKVLKTNTISPYSGTTTNFPQNLGIGIATAPSQFTQKTRAIDESGVLGTEVLTSWTIGAKWVESPAGTFTDTSATITTLTSNVLTAAGKYQFSITTSGIVGGTVTVTYGGLTFTTGATTVAPQTFTFGGTTTSNAAMVITPNAAFKNGIVSNISLKPISASVASFVFQDNTGANSFEIRNSLASLNNVFVGMSAGRSNTTGYQNTFNGMSAGYFNTTGNSNTFSGMNAGYFNTTGNSNTFSGMNAGRSNTTGNSNTFIGMSAGYSNTTGYSNTFSGMSAGYSNTTGYYNTFNGVTAGYSNTTGYSNTFNGVFAGYSNTTGYQNTFISMSAGRYLLDGSALNATSNNSTYDGYDTRSFAATQSYEVVIGSSGKGNGSNTVTLGGGNNVGTTWTLSYNNSTTQAGSNLKIKAQSAFATGTAKLNGGMLELECGQSKDWALASIRLRANTRGAATAQLNTIVDRVIVPSSRILTDEVDSTLFTTTILAADTTTYGNTTSGAFMYQISVKGTNGTQSESGIVTYTGTYWNVTPTVNASINNEVEALSTGTLAATHTLSYAAGVWTMKVNVNSSLTSPVIRYDYVEIKGASSPTFTQF